MNRTSVPHRQSSARTPVVAVDGHRRMRCTARRARPWPSPPTAEPERGARHRGHARPTRCGQTVFLLDSQAAAAPVGSTSAPTRIAARSLRGRRWSPPRNGRRRGAGDVGRAATMAINRTPDVDEDRGRHRQHRAAQPRDHRSQLIEAFAQLVYTLTESGSISAVRILVDGERCPGPPTRANRTDHSARRLPIVRARRRLTPCLRPTPIARRRCCQDPLRNPAPAADQAKKLGGSA